MVEKENAKSLFDSHIEHEMSEEETALFTISEEETAFFPMSQEKMEDIATADVEALPEEVGLFGIKNSSHDFNEPDNWGKNKFNNAFPVALAAYMWTKDLEPVYIKLNDILETEHSKINVKEVFGIEPNSPDVKYTFETTYSTFQKYLTETIPKVDLVVKNIEGDIHFSGIEVKLTALPDNTTYRRTEDKYSSELVVRPDTVVYSATGIAQAYEDDRDLLRSILEDSCGSIIDWTSETEVRPKIIEMAGALNEVLLGKLDKQQPLIMQPVWKTKGKTFDLADNCLDMFIWSNFAYTRLFIDATLRALDTDDSITRQMRTTVWLTKMLYDYACNGIIDHKSVINKLIYNTKNDKSFSITGIHTHKYLTSDELTTPRVTKGEIQRIILGGGEKHLRPERRFDAVLVSSPDIFKAEE